MLRLLFLGHRYLGILLGLIMVIWCLSGFIMMYKSYPELTEQEKVSYLREISFDNCCNKPDLQRLAEQQYQSFHLQMLADIPVLHLLAENGSLITLDLKQQRTFNAVPNPLASRVSEDFAKQQSYPESTLLGQIHNDQWTVYGAYNPHRPLYKIAAEDRAGTQWYMSSRTGEILQLTTREERVWGFLGAVIHWFYPTVLREKVMLWSQLVIWLTIAGIFLTSTGIYFGLRQYKKRQSGRKSPYRGLSFWHHYAGLIFGLLTFSWVLSGLFSMQPWGLLEGEGTQTEQALLRGDPIQWQTISDLLPFITGADWPRDTVRIEGRKLQDELFLLSVTKSGERNRINSTTMRMESLNQDIFEKVGALLSPGSSAPNVELLTEGDSYYYSHHETVQFPVVRIKNAEMIYYLDPVSGALLEKIDIEDKWYRWLHYGLHRGDFSALLRSRPIWDIFMWVLLLGVTAVCTTGFCMGARRLYRTF